MKKLQYYFNRDATNISTISSGKIDNYEFLTGEEIFSSDQIQIVQLVNFTYFHFALKSMKISKQKQLKIKKKASRRFRTFTNFRDIITKRRLNPEIVDELERTEEREQR